MSLAVGDATVDSRARGPIVRSGLDGAGLKVAPEKSPVRWAAEMSCCFRQTMSLTVPVEDRVVGDLMVPAEPMDESKNGIAVGHRDDGPEDDSRIVQVNPYLASEIDTPPQPFPFGSACS